MIQFLFTHQADIVLLTSFLNPWWILKIGKVLNLKELIILEERNESNRQSACIWKLNYTNAMFRFSAAIWKFITVQGEESKKGKLSGELDLSPYVNKRPGWRGGKRDRMFSNHMGKTGERFQTDGLGSRSSRTQDCPDINEIIPFNYRINLATKCRFMFCSSEIHYNA